MSLDLAGKLFDALTKLRVLALRSSHCTKARMIMMFTATARALRSTLDNIATPSSLKARGLERRPPFPRFEIANCDIKASASSALSRNAKSSGNRRKFLLTASFRRPVVTP